MKSERKVSSLALNRVILLPLLERELSFPDVQSFAIFKLGSRQPLIAFGPFILPADEVLKTTALALLVDDAIDEGLHFAVLVDNGRSERLGAIGELVVVVVFVAAEL